MKALVGVDIGTQATKAAIYAEHGERLADATVESQLHRPSPGEVEEDPERQLESVCDAVMQCVQQPGVAAAEIVAIAIDGQMAGVIGVGADGRNVTPYDSWLDTRCAPYIEKMSVLAPEIVRKCGCAPSFNHGPKKLWWKHERPEVFASIHSFVQPGAYVAMRLCGLSGHEAFIDRSYLHFSGFADNQASRWDADLCREFDMPLEKLPRIVAPWDIVGNVTREIAERSGLSQGLPVVAGCGDTAASFLSCGATRAGVCVDVAGTASVFAATTASYRPDESLVLGCGQSATPNLWHPYAYINGGGLNLEWFRTEIAGNATLDELNLAAAAIDDPEAVPLFVPHFAGRVSPAMPHLRGAWVGLDWSHTLGHLYRGALEGVALEYGIYRDVLLDLYPGLDLAEIRVTGGGEKSDIWNQIKASVLETPVVQIQGSGGAPMGAALLAGFGIRLLADLDVAAAKWVDAAARVEPEEARAATYRERVKTYGRLIDALNKFQVS